MRYAILLLMIAGLSGCAEQSTIRQDAERFRNICADKVKNGQIKTAKLFVECESSPVLKEAYQGEVPEQREIYLYYQERLTLADKIDKKSISKDAANKAETEIEEKYAQAFNGEKAPPSLIKLDENFINKTMLYYAIAK